MIQGTEMSEPNKALLALADKIAERRDGFGDAFVDDMTEWVNELRALAASEPGEAVENIAEDSYWAIAEHLGTPEGWSVQEHVWEIADLLRESMFALGSMGANADTTHPQRGLWERINASIKGVQWK